MTWVDAHNEFLITASSETHTMIGNIQFYYSCCEAVDRDQEEEGLATNGGQVEQDDRVYGNSDEDDIGIRENLEQPS